MKKIKRIQLLLWCVALLATALIAYFSAGRGWMDRQIIGTPLFPAFEELAVDTVRVTYADGAFVLARNGDEWFTPTLGDFPLSTQRVIDFLTRLKVARASQEIPGYNDAEKGLYLLNDPQIDSQRTGVLVELFGKAGKIGEVIAGKQIAHERIVGDHIMPSAPTGRYYLNSAGAMVSMEPLAVLRGGLSQWLRRTTIFSMEYIREMSLVSLADNKPVWSIARPQMSLPFAFADGMPGDIDPERADEFVKLWGAPQFQEVIPVAQAPKPEYVLNVRTAEGFKYTVWFARRDLGDQSLGYYWYRAERSNEGVARDVAYDRYHRRIDLPRSTTELDFKLNNDNFFEQWAYVIQGQMYELFVIPRKDLITAPQEIKAGGTRF